MINVGKPSYYLLGLRVQHKMDKLIERDQFLLHYLQLWKIINGV